MRIAQRCAEVACCFSRCTGYTPWYAPLRKRYQTSRSPIAVFLVLFSCAFVSQAEGGSNQQASAVNDQAPQTLQGRVAYVELEGGYYQLVSDEGIKLRPVNFNNWPGCHKHGMLVSGVFKYRSAGRSFYMDNASPVELLELTCEEAVEPAK